MTSPRLYSDLSSWWHLMSAPSEYAEEAEFYREHLEGRTLLELGSGGGNNASHLKADFDLTLVEPSDGMRALSEGLNPECEHVAGDMRTVRLDREFDAVFVHDAIMYMTTEDDLRAAITTAAEHCRPGGVALLSPDCVREIFRPETSHGGHDGEERSLRYLAWSFDPDPDDTVFTTAFAFLLREGDRPVRVERDEHTMGLFPRQLWLDLLSNAGFDPRIVPDRWHRENFVCQRR